MRGESANNGLYSESDCTDEDFSSWMPDPVDANPSKSRLFLCAYMSVLSTAFPVMHYVYTHAHKCKHGAGSRDRHSSSHLAQSNLIYIPFAGAKLATYMSREPHRRVVSHACALAFLRVKLIVVSNSLSTIVCSCFMLGWTFRGLKYCQQIRHRNKHKHFILPLSFLVPAGAVPDSIKCKQRN